MSDKMLKFVDRERQMPEKVAPDVRRSDWHEVYARFAREKAAEQAGRCSQCGVPFCQVHCPLHNNIPDWLMLTAEGRLQEAYEVSAATNTFPEICGRICPQDRLCEGNCVIEQSGHGTVTIGTVENYLTMTAFEKGWVNPITPTRERQESVAIIGAGPGGLAAADILRRKGYQVHVYDRYDRVGGLLIYGIPSFKLEKDIVERRAKLLADGGVQFHLNVEIGQDITFAQLREEHEAILIATGVYQARDIELPGSGLENIVPAMSYLTASNRKGLGDTVAAFEDGSLNAAGKHVVVIGGGDTAMDCVRTAIRQEAASVKCLYRRDRANMPGSQREVTHAEEEGVEFVWLSAPEAYLGEPGTGPGQGVSAVRGQRMRLGPPDPSGRQSPEPITDSTFTLDADLVVTALGFDPQDLPAMFGEPGLTVTRWGTLKADFHTGMTDMEGVFAAGDIVRGASLVVWAIRDGRDAAEAMHQYVQSRAMAETSAVAAQ